MFARVSSSMCKYDIACRNMLCSFRHEFVNEDDVYTLKEDLNKLIDDEQFESRELLYDSFCAAADGYHKCWSEDFE